jgi:hypothetical protein
MKILIHTKGNFLSKFQKADFIIFDNEIKHSSFKNKPFSSILGVYKHNKYLNFERNINILRVIYHSKIKEKIFLFVL